MNVGRDVTIEFLDITQEAKEKTKDGLKNFNQYLENLYNEKGEEQLLYKKHFFYAPEIKKELPKIEGSFDDLQNTGNISEKIISPEVLDWVKKKIRDIKDDQNLEMDVSSNLILDLHFDSLNMAEIAAIIKAEYKKPSNPPLKTLKTVGDLCLMAEGKSTQEEKLPECLLEQKSSPPDKGELEGVLEVEKSGTIPQLFLTEFRKNKNLPFSYDKLFGTQTRGDFLQKAFVVAEIIKQKIPGKHVGIMLPAVQSTSVLIAATYLAKKIPVMLNWTVGEKAMKHCMDTVNLENILTVKSFFKIVKEGMPESMHKNFIFFEEEAKNASIFTKIKGVLKSKIPVGDSHDCHSQDTAVILFTSGSESLPKAVPLTHENILHDLWGTLEILTIEKNQKVLGFLPPFHSFGFTVSVILPLITGMRIAYTPDPTDAGMIVQMLRHTKANILLSTPTFLKMILSQSQKEDFESVEKVITGAEACHQSLKDQLTEITDGKAKILEGYGITECSPVVSINPQKKQKQGSVGKTIAGLECIVADIQTNKILEANQEGMIYVRGKSIFNGYFQGNIGAISNRPNNLHGEEKIQKTEVETSTHRVSNIPTPFTEINGEKYYKTGDLGKIDKDGYLFITGRLKRFIKIGGEMISLPFLENTLLEKFGKEEYISLAIEGRDDIDSPKLALFSVDDINTKEANDYLREKGASNIMQIHEVQKVEEIPLLGTGKVDYKILKNMIS